MRFSVPEHIKICIFLCQSIKIKSTNMYFSRARVHFKINKHTVTEVLKLTLQTGCQSSSTTLALPLEMCFWHNFGRCETSVLDNWQQIILPHYGISEFHPRLVHDNSSVPLWVVCVSLCQSIKMKPTNVFIVAASAQFKINKKTIVWYSFDMFYLFVAYSLASESMVKHYCDVMMSTIASQCTSLTIVRLTIYSGAKHRKHQSSVSLALCGGRWIPRKNGQ